MSTTAKFVKEITVVDPDTGGDVHLEVYKHEGGGMLAIDSSFLEQSTEDDKPYQVIQDPFADMGEPQILYLED